MKPRTVFAALLVFAGIFIMYQSLENEARAKRIDCNNHNATMRITAPNYDRVPGEETELIGNITIKRPHDRALLFKKFILRDIRKGQTNLRMNRVIIATWNQEEVAEFLNKNVKNKVFVRGKLIFVQEELPRILPKLICTKEK